MLQLRIIIIQRFSHYSNHLIMVTSMGFRRIRMAHRHNLLRQHADGSLKRPQRLQPAGKPQPRTGQRHQPHPMDSLYLFMIKEETSQPRKNTSTPQEPREPPQAPSRTHTAT